MPKIRIPFTQVRDAAGAASYMPFVPLTLQYQSQSLTVSGMLDTGATVNVLPFSIGTALGAVWQRQTTSLVLSGNLARQEARALILTTRLADFEPVRLAFAWTRADDVPVILGQVNFFMTFDVCFYRAELAFEIELH